MNPISLRNELDFISKYGDDWTAKVLGEGNIEEIAFIVYRLLDSDSKKYLAKREVETCDDNGESITTTMGGVELLINTISGKQEAEALMLALYDNIGISRAVINEDDVKKKEIV